MPDIHPTAVVSPDARIAEGAEIGPFCVIDGPATLASGVTLAGHAWLHGRVSIGEESSIGWGAVIGADPQDLSFDPTTDSSVEIGPRNIIREYVTVHRSTQPGGATRTGAGVMLMVASHLAHDCVVGEDTVLANNVMLGGHVHIGKRVFLGGGAGFHQFIQVGSYSIAQGNASISKDIPPFCVAHGLNRISGLNSIGLRRAGLAPATRSEIKRLFKLLFRSELPLSEAVKQAEDQSWSDTARLLLDAAAHPSRKGIITRQ
jgi:UDP-N-acetylglucosamine acyltransferase